MSRLQPLRLVDLLRTDFRTSTEGDAANSRLVRDLAFDYRYQPARLAISFSLNDSRIPNTPPELLGKPIRGETLFGPDEADIGLWIGLLVEHASLEAPTRRDVIELVAGHWQRGARTLSRRLGAWNGEPSAFVLELANKVAA